MFVCIVMEYYNQGDLGRLLRKERERVAAIPEAVRVYSNHLYLFL